MIEAAETWYSSETLWAVAVPSAVALLVGVPTFLVTWAPRQRLFYGAQPATSLVTGETGISGLEVLHRGRLLAHPQLFDVVLASRRRRDIPSSAFDQSRPLVFDVDAPIVEVLRVRCDPPSALVPPVSHDANLLKVGPELIRRRQSTTISLLVDGPPRLSCAQPVLAQVFIARRDDLTSSGFWSRRWQSALVAVTIVMAALTAAEGAAAALVNAGSPPGVPLVEVVAVAMAAAATVTAMAAAAVAGWRHRRKRAARRFLQEDDRPAPGRMAG